MTSKGERMEKDPGRRLVSLEELTERSAVFQPYPVAGFSLQLSRVHWADLGQPLRLVVTLAAPE